MSITVKKTLKIRNKTTNQFEPLAALRGRDGADGQQGPQGISGATGPQGPAGEDGHTPTTEEIEEVCADVISNATANLVTQEDFGKLTTNKTKVAEIDTTMRTITAETESNANWKKHFSIGTLKSSNGAADANVQRCRTNNYFPISKFVKINSGNKRTQIFVYDSTCQFLGKSSTWIPIGSEITKADIDALGYTNAEYVRFIFSESSSVDIADVDTFFNAIDFSGTLYEEKFTKAEYYGEKIELDRAMHYSMRTKADIEMAVSQSMAQYGDYYFGFNSSGKCYAGNLKTYARYGYCTFATTDIPHCNVAFFGNEKHSASDKFPLVYVNAYNNEGLPKGTLYAYRITGDVDAGSFNLEKVQTITIGFTTDSVWTDGSSDNRPYGNFVCDFDRDNLYAFTLLDTTNVTRFFKFDMPKLADGSNVTLAKTDITDQFDVKHTMYIQDACYHNGYLMWTSGTTSETKAEPNAIHIIDLTKRQLVAEVILSSVFGGVVEAEGIVVYNNEIVIRDNQCHTYNLSFV